MEISIENSLKKFKCNYHMTQQLHYLVYTKMRWSLYTKDTLTPMFITALFTIAKMWYICPMWCYSAIKSDILSFASTWMELEIIMLSETSQTHKDKWHMLRKPISHPCRSIEQNSGHWRWEKKKQRRGAEMN
jgi:hypothetical protein